MGGIIPTFAGTGQSVAATIMDMQTAQMWNGAALEVFNGAHYNAQYGVAMPEQTGSGRYIMTMPGSLPTGNYWVTPYILSAPPNLTIGVDNPLDVLRVGWDMALGLIIDINSPLNVGKINGSSPAALNLALSANQFAIGAAAAGTLTSTQMTTNLPGTVANIYAGRVLIFTSGVNAGLAVLITAFAVTGAKLTLIAYNNLPAPAAPGVGDTFLIQ